MIKVIGRARIGYAEVVLHDGENACKIGGEAYTDNSRNSVVCAEHRKEYQKRQKKQRGKKQIEN